MFKWQELTEALIKLNRGVRPDKLTDNLVVQLTDDFKNNTGLRVWDKSFIKNALLNFSYGKCCYCETKLREESKYCTVDHYHHKNKYPDEVVAWDNLLPVCSRCNSKKGTHDTYVMPIIDPTKHDPKQYLFLYNYRYKSRDNDINSIGWATIDVLGLNDSQTMVYPRINIGEAVQTKLADLIDRIHRYSEDESDVRESNKIISTITDILKLALPVKEYSAVTASAILGDVNYIRIKDRMAELDLWNEELVQLEDNLGDVCLLESCFFQTFNKHN